MILPLSSHAEHYWLLATWETDVEKRRELLEKAEKAGMEALKLAEDSGIPRVIGNTLHIASKTLQARAHMEPDSTEKRSLLEKALKCREKTIEINEQLYPFDYWGRGVAQNYLAGIKAELADIEPDLDSKRRLLEKAVLSKEKGLKLINKIMPYHEKMGYTAPFAALQIYQDNYATLLTQLYDLTNKPEHLRKAIELSQKAIESASKLDMRVRIAESYWKIAKSQDLLREYPEAAESFQHASENYTKSSERIRQLKDFYQDHASYMQAWSEIEKAKHNHTEKKYGLAKEHYEKAAGLHKETARWHYLSASYSALARVEEAEDLSRNEQTEEAKNLFQQAAKLFTEAKQSVQAKLKKMESKDEIEMATTLSKASDIRREYCLGRIALEEAKILDRQGDHTASSGKYGSASEKLQEAIDIMEHESDRKELRHIVILTRAWQKMTRAEADASPNLYLEASKLFDQAKELNLDEKARVLALGHSSFCKALEAGTRFEATRDNKLHLAAIRHLESASSYYVKAGFKTASEYAKATHRIFDAYIYTDKAYTETDPAKKTQHYQMAEKLLQASADSYMKAKQPDKSEEAQRLLESVKEERQLALSLAQELHAPAITSTTTSFSTPTQTYEEAVGLEIFDHAHIQANLIVQKGDVNVGEEIALEIEMVNAGKGAATLVKVEDFIPTAEFKVVGMPQMYRIEDSCLNMRGKRLDPLKTEDVRIVTKPQAKGVFTIKPQIRYLDEYGKYRSHQPEPVTITVKELGIKGWIKGER